jgi:transcriptional regulator with XRE-family HTH domain
MTRQRDGIPSDSEGRNTSPTLLRRRLGSELRRLREAAGLTTQQVAARLYCSPSKISRVETARVAATPRDVRDMLELYRVSDQQQEDLMQLAHEARQRDAWWHSYRDVPDVRTFMSLEKAANSIRIYASLIIPGLLQVQEYARLITQIILPTLGHQEIDRHVELRMARQALLAADDATPLWVVLDEASLRRLIGMPQVRLQQLQHLAEVAETPNVTIQILPFQAGPHRGMIGSFTILSFSDSADPDVVHIESPMGEDLYLNSADQIRRYGLLFEHLRDAALGPDESAIFLARLMRE